MVVGLVSFGADVQTCSAGIDAGTGASFRDDLFRVMVSLSFVGSYQLRARKQCLILSPPHRLACPIYGAKTARSLSRNDG